MRPAVFFVTIGVLAGCSEPATPAAAVDAGAAATFATDATKLADTKSKDAGGADVASAGDVTDEDTAPDSDDDTVETSDFASADDVVSPPEDVSPTVCTPQCVGKTCGIDGCGGTCGGCTDKEQCQVGKCVAKPNLGCSGLALKENWVGKFKGDCTFVGAGGLVPIKTKTSGDMTFAIKCFNSKYLVSGKMDGEASGNKFSLTLGGTYDPGKLTLTGKLTDGTILLWNIFTYQFEGPIEGTLGATGTFDGAWQVDSTDVKFLGQPSPTTPPFKANGTWSATGT